MSFISYGGSSSMATKVNITSRKVYDAPAYDVTALSAPGLSGDILVPQNRFKNKTIVYNGYIRAIDFSGSTLWERMSNGTRSLKAWLLSDPGVYKDLRDDYDPGFSRFAYCESVNFSQVHDLPDGATVEITFIAKPFLYDNQNNATVSFTGTKTFNNPYSFGSRPTLSILVSRSPATFTVNGETWTITGFNSNTTIACNTEAMEWYTSSGLVNDKVSGPKPFPEFTTGANTVTCGNWVTGIGVTPNWRTL